MVLTVVMNHSTLIETPVVVVGSWTTALSVIRLASKVSHSVYAACPIDSWPCQTKYYRELPGADGAIWRGDLGDSGYTNIKQLPFDRCVLIPAADDAALWLARLPKGLSSRYFVSGSSFETLEMLQDKAKFSKLINQLGIPTPHSFNIQNVDDIINIPFEKLEAVFLKPTDSQAFVKQYNKKAIWVDSKEQALAEWNRINADGFSIIAQEYVSGGADDHYFIDGFRDRDGNVRAVTARRRLRIYPIDFGNSSYCYSIPFIEVEQAWVGLERLLHHTKYRGIFSAEFKKDARDGLFKILEINTRPWIYIEFADVCGMNMCDLYIRDALEMDVPTIKNYRVGLGCVDLYNDLAATIKMPSSERPNIFKLLVTWVRSFKLLFAWRDPKPAIKSIFRRTSLKLKKVFAK